MFKKLFRKVFPKTRWYLQQKSNDQTYYFGPFEYKELHVRKNDAFGEALSIGGDLEEFQMTDEEASKFYINDRECWLKQTADLTDD